MDKTDKFPDSENEIISDKGAMRWIAAMLMMQIARTHNTDATPDQCAAFAVADADALIKALETPPTKPTTHTKPEGEE